jgi:uncharacterized membrane protein YcjF (UPF0283 family)
MKEYLKEEITTIREVVKLIIIIIVALIGSMVNFLVKFFEKEEIFYLLISLIAFLGSLLFLIMLKKFWEKLYELKFKLKDLNE